jgi:hypothetical protein
MNSLLVLARKHEPTYLCDLIEDLEFMNSSSIGFLSRSLMIEERFCATTNTVSDAAGAPFMDAYPRSLGNSKPFMQYI